jgi:hypothetical protein
MMLKEGNTMRRHVARILDDKSAAAPKKSKRPKSPKAKKEKLEESEESEESESSPSPKQPPKKKKITKVKVKKPKVAAGKTPAEKEARRKAIEAWEQTPASKDASGAARCWLHAQNPAWCKKDPCPFKTPAGAVRSHAPAGP